MLSCKIKWIVCISFEFRCHHIEIAQSPTQQMILRYVTHTRRRGSTYRTPHVCIWIFQICIIHTQYVYTYNKKWMKLIAQRYYNIINNFSYLLFVVFPRQVPYNLQLNDESIFPCKCLFNCINVMMQKRCT